MLTLFSFNPKHFDKHTSTKRQKTTKQFRITGHHLLNIVRLKHDKARVYHNYPLILLTFAKNQAQFTKTRRTHFRKNWSNRIGQPFATSS